jgi:hypothetical protein
MVMVFLMFKSSAIAKALDWDTQKPSLTVWWLRDTSSLYLACISTVSVNSTSTVTYQLFVFICL